MIACTTVRERETQEVFLEAEFVFMALEQQKLQLFKFMLSDKTQWYMLLVFTKESAAALMAVFHSKPGFYPSRTLWAFKC